jgi:hypothetical protein
LNKAKDLKKLRNMAKTNKIAAIILGAAAGLALVKFLSMPKEEREDFYDFM